MNINRNDLLQQISNSFVQMKRAMFMSASDDFAQLGLPPAQLGMLRAIYFSQPISQKELAKQMQLTPGAISQFIDGLDQAGCIVRTTNEADRRTSYLSISRHGSQVLKHYEKVHLQRLTKAFSDVSDADIATYARIQQSIIRGLESSNQK